MQVAFFSNCDCDSVTVATRFFTFLPFYPFTFLPFYLFTFIKRPPFKQKKGVPSDAPNCNMCYKITLQSEQ